MNNKFKMKNLMSLLLAFAILVTGMPILDLGISESQAVEQNVSVIDKSIDKLRNEAIASESLSFRNTLGYVLTSKDIEEARKELAEKQIVTDKEQVASIAGDIIALVASGENPYDYKGKDYVKALLDLQDEKGLFGKEGSFDRYSGNHSYAIVALEMAKADYDRELTLKAFNNYIQNDHFGFGETDPDSNAMVLFSLQYFEGNKEAEHFKNLAIDHIKQNHKGENGGVIGFNGKENINSAIAVGQGLIAIGEDINSETWTSNGKTLREYLNNNIEEMSNISFGKDQVLDLLYELKTGRSVYKELSYEKEEEVYARVDVLVRTHKENLINESAVEISKGETAIEVLLKLLEKNGMDYTNNSGYISMINGLEAFDEGPNSGWMYKVNGKLPNVGMAGYKLEEGDKLDVFYTTDYNNEWGKPEEPEKPVEEPFTDMDGFKWGKEAVFEMYELGFISGVGQNKFEPARNISRAEFAVIISQMFELEEVGDNPFSDIKKKDWYYEYVLKAYNAGFIKGRPGGKFDPKANITREEIARITSVILEEKKIDFEKAKLDKFKDYKKVSKWAKEGMEIAVGAGIVAGSDGKLNPQNPAMRVEAAAMLHRLYLLIK